VSGCVGLSCLLGLTHTRSQACAGFGIATWCPKSMFAEDPAGAGAPLSHPPHEPPVCCFAVPRSSRSRTHCPSLSPVVRSFLHPSSQLPRKRGAQRVSLVSSDLRLPSCPGSCVYSAMSSSIPRL